MTRTEALIHLAAGFAAQQGLSPADVAADARDALHQIEGPRKAGNLPNFDPEPRGQKYGWPQAMEAIAGSLARIERHIGASDRHTTPLPEDDDKPGDPGFPDYTDHGHPGPKPEDDDSGLSGFRIVVRDGDRQVIGDDVANLAAQCNARGAPLGCGPFDLYAFQDGEGD